MKANKSQKLSSLSKMIDNLPKVPGPFEHALNMLMAIITVQLTDTSKTVVGFAFLSLLEGVFGHVTRRGYSDSVL